MTVRGVSGRAKQALRIRAARHGHSMAEELRSLLDQVADEELPQQTTSNFADEMLALFGKEDGFDIELPERDEGREPPSFDD